MKLDSRAIINLMAIDIEKIKPEVAKVAQKHNLALVILYGSQATGKAREGSDIDVAILGKRKIPFNLLLNLNDEFAHIFKTRELDVKSLHSTNPFFRYQVMRDGILLYGKSYDYNSYKAYAFRDYHDSKDLLKLKRIIVERRLQALKTS